MTPELASLLSTLRELEGLGKTAIPGHSFHGDIVLVRQLRDGAVTIAKAVRLLEKMPEIVEEAWEAGRVAEPGEDTGITAKGYAERWVDAMEQFNFGKLRAVDAIRALKGGSDVISNAIIEKMARAIYEEVHRDDDTAMLWAREKGAFLDGAGAVFEFLAAEGFVVVPTEATEAMLRAGYATRHIDHQSIKIVWDAMLSASALPVTQDPDVR